MLEIVPTSQYFHRNDLAARCVHNLVTLLQIDCQQPASLPIQHVEDNQAAMAGGDRIRDTGHAAAHHKAAEFPCVDSVQVLHRQLLDSFPAGWIIHTVVGIPCVLIHHDHIGPHPVQVHLVRCKIRIDQRSQRGQLFRRWPAAFILALHGCVICVRTYTIFPVWAAIAANCWHIITELLCDVCDSLVES